MNPKQTTTDETLARWGDLAREAVRTQAALARESVALTRATVSGELDPADAGRAYAEAVGREGARYWRAVAEIGVDYASDLVSLTNRVAATVLAETARAGRRGAGTPSSPPPRSTAPHSTGGGPVDSPEPGRRVALLLRGPVGGRAESTVTVVNRHPRARRVQLTPGTVRDADGREVAVQLQVDPARVTIAAGGEHQVTVATDLPAAHVVIGATYRATVDVSGGDEATLDVEVEVTG